MCHAEHERPHRLILGESPTGLHGAPKTLLVSEIKARIPRVWLKSANFHHAKHAGMKCAECHGGAGTSEKHNDLLFGTLRAVGQAQVIELRAKCAECHRESPAGSVANATQARFDCAQCHYYHGGERPRHGSGAPFRVRTPNPDP